MSSTFVAREEFRVNTTTARDQGAASLATLADGSFVIVWQSQQPADFNDGRLPYAKDLLAQRFNASGAAIDAEKLLVHFALDQAQASVAARADGGYSVAYAGEQDYDGRYRRFDFGVYSLDVDAQGNATGNTSWSNNQLGNQDRPSATVLADGSQKVVYTTAGSAEVGMPAGVVGAPGGTTIGGASEAVVTGLAQGGYAMAWTAGGAVYTQAFGGAGNGAFQVDATDASHAAIASLADGGYIVAWQSGGDVFVQRYDAGGVSNGATQRANASAAGSQDAPTITVLRDGGWVVAWESADSDGRGIFFQRFDAAGNAVDSESRVNANAAGDQFDAALTALHDGGFVAAWSSMQADGSLDIFARQFLASNLPHTIDLAGNEGRAWRLYQAAFDRAPDEAGLAYQANALDSGLSLNLVASHFIASPEFGSRYGALDDYGFVTQLYANVLQRAPDDGGLAYHVGNLQQHGFARGDVLVGFSESPENQALVLSALPSGGAFG